MRLWTIHPRYLDPVGLVALWRETLLARQVLLGKTIGYRAHPQLVRFRIQPDPVASLSSYLLGVYEESVSRGYRFDSTKIGCERAEQKMVETEGQLLYEWKHLKTKLQRRRPDQFARLSEIISPEPHPLFMIVPGQVRAWERVDHRV